MGSLFFEENILNCISFCRRKKFWSYGKTFSARLVRTAFFVSSGSFHEEKFFEKPCSFTWGNSLKLSRNSTLKFRESCQNCTLHARGKISWENFLWKKNNSFPDNRRKFSWFIAKRVFWGERQNRTACVQNKHCEENTFEKKLKNLQ